MNAPAPAAAKQRRYFLWGCVALVLVATVLASAWWGADRVARDPLDPSGADPRGSRALANVLAENGTSVEVVRSLPELQEHEPGPGTTIVVTSSQYVGGETAAHLRDLAAVHRVVVVAPPPGLLDALSVNGSDESDPPAVTAACSAPNVPGLPDLSGLELVVPHTGTYDLPGCFPIGSDTALGVLPPQSSTATGSLILLGAEEAMANRSITAGDNAAVALRLLGQDEHLLWYVADAGDLLSDEDPPASALLPTWLFPALWLLLLSGAALALWQGRRLGPLSVEPLPVQVRAIESTLGRGRLQHRSRDRGHAAMTLRAATARRLLHAGGSGPAPNDEAVRVLIDDIAQRTGQHVTEISGLLDPHAPAPTDDDALVRLAQALTALEKEVRRS